MSNSGGAARSLAAGSVQHLLELGYEDPWELAARQQAKQRAQQAELNRAEELVRAGQVTEAIALLESAAAADAEWTAVRHLLARAYFRSGRFADAMAMLDWLEVHAVEHVELALMRATIALRQRQFDAAVDQAAYAGRLQSPLPAAELIVAEVAFRRGNTAAAEQTYRSVVEQFPQQAEAYVGMAAMAMREGRCEDAADWALQAIELDGRRWQAHCHLGRALIRLGQVSAAKTALDTAARLAPERAAPLYWRRRIAELEGDAAAAETYRELGRQRLARRRPTAAGTSGPSVSS